MQRLKGRVAIVTGAARGIGQVFARRLGREGAKVVVADILDPGATMDLLKAQGSEVLGIQVDVTRFDRVKQMVEETVGAFGRIDILVNNAALLGGLKLKPFDAIPEEEWDAVFAVNVKGVWNCCRAVVPQMKAQGGGVIINISSATIIEGAPLLSHYVASKGAIWALTRALAREVGEYGIRVNSITPGFTMTEAAKGLSSDPAQMEFIYKVAMEQRIFKRPMEPEDLEGVLVFLASDESGFITGQNINVEGGARHY